MFKKCSLAVLLCLTFINVSQANQPILNINDVNWPPYFFIENPGHTHKLGIAKEILNHCIAKSGYKTNYIGLPIKRTHYYMESGILDITVYSYKKDREKILKYSSEPIFSSEYGFLVKADSKIVIDKVSDVLPYQLGHLAGLTYTPEYMNIINEKMALKEVTTGQSLEAMFNQLLAPQPRFELMADSKATFHWYAQEAGLSDKIKVLDFTLKNKNYFITVSKKSENISDIQAFINDTDHCIKALKQNGDYQTILEKYGQ
jgi:polar amino acid transport system substrate-binding protein